MAVQEEYEGQRRTAYHEAGHAIAAIRTPRGAVEHIDICNRDEDDAENGGTNSSSPDADDAFRVYGGPWAHVKFYRPTESISIERVLACMRDNADDWFAFHDIAARDARNGSTGSIQDWHARADTVMASAWEAGEIQDLAERMLARQKEIRLSNGQLLVRASGRNRWIDEDYVQAPRGGRGLVGPLPPFNQGV